MVLSTQKLIIVNITIMLLFATLAAFNPDHNADLTTIGLFTGNTEQSLGKTEMESQDMVYGDVKTTNPVQENKVGNMVKLGSKVWDAFTAAIIPWDVPGYRETDEVSRIIYIGIALFRSFMLILLGLELLLIYMNKKAT